MSHLGRPKGVTPALSLRHIVSTVSTILEKEVFFAEDVIGEDAQNKANLRPGEILLLENLRFHAEETNAIQALHGWLAWLIFMSTTHLEPPTEPMHQQPLSPRIFRKTKQ